MSKYAVNDSYVDPASGVLKNKLGITDEKILEAIEADFVTARLFELSQSPLTVPFNSVSLQTIHKRLFSDLYEWAGIYRTVDIAKGTSRFANFKHIEALVNTVFVDLQRDNFLKNLNKHQFSQRAAYYMGELNAIHPFREGNGRTQRELINQIAFANHWMIDWQSMSTQSILEATISSFSGHYEPLTRLIHEHLKG
jgi:cell filamentation protein